MNYSTINLGGGLFTPDLLERISQADSSVPGQSPSDALLRWDAFSRRRTRSRQNLTTLTRRDWAIPRFKTLGFPPLDLQRGSISESLWGSGDQRRQATPATRHRSYLKAHLQR